MINRTHIDVFAISKCGTSYFKAEETMGVFYIARAHFVTKSIHDISNGGIGANLYCKLSNMLKTGHFGETTQTKTMPGHVTIKLQLHFIEKF